MKTRFLLLACTALVLSGCSTWLVDSVSPPDGSLLRATYVGSGNQQFQCTADNAATIGALSHRKFSFGTPRVTSLLNKAPTLRSVPPTAAT